MSEKIILYIEQNNSAPIFALRSEVYDNRRTQYKDHYIYVIDIFLFTSSWQLLLQKRSKSKKTSPWQYHTSVWGHLNEWEIPEFTVVHECMEELGSSCFIVPENQSFETALRKLGDYTNKMAIIQHQKDYYKDLVDYTDAWWRVYSSKDRVYLCFWIYDWPVHCLDKEADWFEYFTIEDLKEELQTNPLKFTSVLHHFIETLWDDMIDFVNKYCKK